MPALDDWKLTSFFEISVGSCGFHQLQKRPKQGHKVAQMAITCVFNLKCSDFFATKSATNIRWTYIRYQTALSTDICSHSLSHLAGMFGIFANGNSLATRIPGRCQEHRFNIFNFKIKRKQRKGRQLSQYSTHLWQKNRLEIFFFGGETVSPWKEHCATTSERRKRAQNVRWLGFGQWWHSRNAARSCYGVASLFCSAAYFGRAMQNHARYKTVNGIMLELFAALL